MLRVCFNCYGNYTTDSVYQWDLNHELMIQGVNISANAPTVHFCNKRSDKAIVVQSEIIEGCIRVQVPNELLMEPYNIIAFIHTYSNNHAKTIEVVNIPLIKRPKPDDYQFIGNVEVMNFERLTSDMTDLINTMSDYRENIDNTMSDYRQTIDDKVEEIKNLAVSVDGGYPNTKHTEEVS